MSAPPAQAAAGEPERAPWEPFTFRGVAAFAGASLGRLLLVELIAALVFAGTAVWFVNQNDAPVIARAIHQMPAGARIEQGRLAGVTGPLIAETKFLAIAITPVGRGDIGESADIQVQFRREDLSVVSVFSPDYGLVLGYGRRNMDLSRAALEPGWGAWRPVMLAAMGATVVVYLLITWAALSFLYSFGAKFLAFYADRALTWRGARRLCAAALMPGAALMTLGLALYGLGWTDLVGLCCFFAAHFVVGIIYTVGGVLATSRAIPPPGANPFSGQSEKD